MRPAFNSSSETQHTNDAAAKKNVLHCETTTFGALLHMVVFVGINKISGNTSNTWR